MSFFSWFSLSSTSVCQCLIDEIINNIYVSSSASLQGIVGWQKISEDFFSREGRNFSRVGFAKPRKENHTYPLGKD